MKRLFASLVLLVISITLLLPAASAKGTDYLDIVTYSTQAVTGIQNTAAVFHGKVVETFIGLDKPAITGAVIPWFIFHYGTSPGSYTHRVNAVMGSPVFYQDSIWAYFTASVTGLLPCQEYYVQLYIPPEYRQYWEPYIQFKIGPAARFTTTGCQIGAIGQGGMATGPGTSSSSALPVSTPVQMASIAVQDAKVGTPMVSPGQSVDIAATVTNKGTASGDAKVTLYVNGEPMESKGITVAAGQTAPVNFSVDRNEPGTYTVHVNSTPAGSFTVDMFSNNDTLIYSIIALLVLGIAGTLFFLLRKRSA